MADVKLKHEDVVKFLKDKTSETSNKNDMIVLQVNKAPYNKFMESKGVTKEMIETVEQAQEDYLNGAIEFVRDKFVDDYSDSKKVTLYTRTGFGRQDISVEKEHPYNDPRTREKAVKYGSVSVRMSLRSKFDSDIIESCAKAMEAIS